MTRTERADTIRIICEKCGCNEEQRKRHHRLFVDEQWNVHPSKRFKQWWFKQDEYKESLGEDGNGIGAIAAQNARRIWQSYLEAKEIGLA